MYEHVVCYEVYYFAKKDLSSNFNHEYRTKICYALTPRIYNMSIIN